MKPVHLVPLLALCAAVANPAGAELPFVAGPAFDPGPQPWGCLAADIDGKGGIDLAVANFAVPGSATVLLGNGAGSFAAIAQPPVAKGPWGIASGDFDSDGKLDLVVSSISNDPTDIVTVMLGNGDGSFDAGVEHEVGGNPQFVKVADLDDDGNDDIVLVSSDAEAVSVFLGHGDGTFAARGDFALGLAPMNLVVKDIDGDGIEDVVAAANSFFAAFAILKGVGDGNFEAPAYGGTNGFYHSVTADDFNRDGLTDVALLHRAFSRVDVFLAQGPQQFGDFVSLPTDADVCSVGSADLYGDGRIQIVTAGYSGIRIFESRDDGTFDDMGAIPDVYGGYDIVFADLNGDGALDLFSADASRVASRVLLNQTVFRSGFD